MTIFVSEIVHYIYASLDFLHYTATSIMNTIQQMNSITNNDLPKRFQQYIFRAMLHDESNKSLEPQTMNA